MIIALSVLVLHEPTQKKIHKKKKMNRKRDAIQ